MKREVLSKYDMLTVGETPLMTPDYASLITHPTTPAALSMVFEFEHMELDTTPGDAPSDPAVEPARPEET